MLNETIIFLLRTTRSALKNIIQETYSFQDHDHDTPGKRKIIYTRNINLAIPKKTLIISLLAGKYASFLLFLASGLIYNLQLKRWKGDKEGWKDK